MTTAWRIALGATVAVVLSATSCAEDSGSDGDDDGTGGPSDDDGGLDCTPNDSNGETQCTNQLCVASTYCDPFDGLCSNGCESTLNCALGDYCDKRMPTQSLDGSRQMIVRSPLRRYCGTARTSWTRPWCCCASPRRSHWQVSRCYSTSPTGSANSKTSAL